MNERIIFKVVAALLLGLLGQLAQAGTVTYVYTDPQGTPLAEADASGNITATFDYKPYGSQALGTPKAAPGYAGHVSDPDTGFVYMQARYYDPGVGRFLSIDPAGISASDIYLVNRFSYGNNNPVSHIDPDGRQTLPLYVYQTNWLDPRVRAAQTQIELSLIPGYGLYDCAKNGCGKLGWSLSAAGTILPAVGLVKKISAIASVAREVSAAEAETTRVGRWMSKKEFNNMKASGEVQESYSGTTHVADPADINAFIDRATPGSIYAEFDVPTSSLRSTGEGWSKILGPNSLEGRFAAKNGLDIPMMPKATNISEPLATRIR